MPVEMRSDVVVKSGLILIVDDDPLIQMNYVDILSGNGCIGVPVGDISGAWHLLYNRSFDLMICDHDLPDGKGVQLIQRMDSSGFSIPIIYLTGAHPGTYAGTSKYSIIKKVLKKPVNEHELIRAVRGHLTNRSDILFPRLISTDERNILLTNLAPIKT